MRLESSALELTYYPMASPALGLAVSCSFLIQSLVTPAGVPLSCLCQFYWKELINLDIKRFFQFSLRIVAKPSPLVVNKHFLVVKFIVRNTWQWPTFWIDDFDTSETVSWYLPTEFFFQLVDGFFTCATKSLVSFLRLWCRMCSQGRSSQLKGNYTVEDDDELLYNYIRFSTSYECCRNCNVCCTAQYILILSLPSECGFITKVLLSVVWRILPCSLAPSPGALRKSVLPSD